MKQEQGVFDKIASQHTGIFRRAVERPSALAMIAAVFTKRSAMEEAYGASMEICQRKGSE